MPNGTMILDTPGMRELQLSHCEQGVAATFRDIDQLSRQCRFGNCHHGNEPGCAIAAALGCGELDQRRFDNYAKLLREQAHNSATLAERRAGDRALSKYYSRAQKQAKKFKRG